jgi:hypothetical protein
VSTITQTRPGKVGSERGSMLTTYALALGQ